MQEPATQDPYIELMKFLSDTLEQTLVEPCHYLFLLQPSDDKGTRLMTNVRELQITKDWLVHVSETLREEKL